MFKACLPPLHLPARDLQRDERIFKHKGLLCAVSSAQTAILFSKEIKRELKYLAKPDLGSTLVAVGCTVDSANAPDCINFNGKRSLLFLTCLAFGTALGQRQGPAVCCWGGLLLGTAHHSGPAWPQPVRLH